MEIRDLVHGSVTVDPAEIPIVESRPFQRLRQIKQMGFAEYSFPGASHSRYLHSIGAMATASRLFSIIFDPIDLQPSDRRKFRSLVRIAALLHDVGHGPLSHTTEFAMPPLSRLRVPGLENEPERQANHEDYTLKIILDTELSRAIDHAGDEHGFTCRDVASLINPSLRTKTAGMNPFLARFQGQQIDFHPILRQLVSSELDADRMDYLLRDSRFAGVSYGDFDFDWISRNLTLHLSGGRAFLCLKHRALYSFEDFLLSRFHMFLMVYFHHKGVIYEEMLGQYLRAPDCEYRLPSDIDEYCARDDSHLLAHLASSENQWARRISTKNPYRMLLEIHSGIPASDQSTVENQKLLADTEQRLKQAGIHSLFVTSTGELSKYFRRPGDPIFVRYHNYLEEPSHIPVEECTDLFSKYREKRFIARIYVAPEDHERAKRVARGWSAVQ